MAISDFFFMASLGIVKGRGKVSDDIERKTYSQLGPVMLYAIHRGAHGCWLLSMRQDNFGLPVGYASLRKTNNIESLVLHGRGRYTAVTLQLS